MVAGWGPFTDQPIINNAQGWPSSLIDFYWSINQNGYIDSLVGVGYDVILAKFYPPNVNVLKNVSALQHLITLVNEEKFSNGSYHENIVAGYSAGAMCVRLTLELMEWEHMQDPIYPHHHSKLFISFDGEHAGANIPLGIQHARSEEHTSELQSRPHLVCRLLLEKKKMDLGATELRVTPAA